MKKKKIVIPHNYLERIPAHPTALHWKTDDDGIVTLEVENTGWVNRLVQKCFGRPRVSYIHLDRFGSFVWQQIDGVKTITALGELVEAQFGEEAHPLYERLARYFQILDSYHFIQWKDNQ